MRKNEIYPMEISGMTNEGNGVGRIQGLAVFVPMTAVGDQINVRIVKVLKNYAYGIVESIRLPSAARKAPDCAVYAKCGGCAFQHITYAEELKMKYQFVADAFSRLGGISCVPDKILESPASIRYRNKAQFPLGESADGKAVCGFFAGRSHRIIPCTDCLLQPVLFGKILDVILEWANQYQIPVYRETERKGLLRHVYLRQGEATGEVMVCLVATEERLPYQQALLERLQIFPEVRSVILNKNDRDTNVVLGPECITLWGKDTISDILCGVRVELSPLSFYQVNRAGAEQLYREVERLANLSGEECLLDLYCGAGTIGLSMAGKVKKMLGVEIVPEAIDNARRNAEQNSIVNAEFLCADAGAAAQTLEQQGFRPDVIIVDPPRKGCSIDTLEAMVRMAPHKIVMISCNPSTAARDCRILQEKGYDVDYIRPVDMFPRTTHVETVVLLSKLKVDHHIEIELKMDELDLTAAESKATYDEIKAYVFDKYGLKVSQLYIAQVKRKCGIIERKNYNVSKKEDAKVPQCPPEKEAAIMDALKHFQMI
ncbi:MAG TPA: 23S rRNA (uracil(1939)-C(5))-methyltransferase RlmD [Firmicutes bacterium]|nr:23S rRNA (uracil(1939)-C(5))-methyltransferase RlmD [Bacillota bacterium]